MSKTGTLVFASLALALSLAIGSTHASSITYDFTGSSSGLGTGNLGIGSATVISGGLPVLVEAFDEFGAAGLLARNNMNGLGVVGEPGTGQETNQVGADSNGGESLEFDFTPNSVTVIDTVVFELGMEAGSLDVFADNVLLETISWTAATGGGNTGNSDVAYTFTSSVAARTAQSFTFAAVEDSFRVKSLTVELIPEPASLLLLVVGAAAIAIGSRRHEG
ncbi:MAG: PEP-CTERM sorting domain-containing protein [Planctomycetota bacterium]